MGPVDKNYGLPPAPRPLQSGVWADAAPPITATTSIMTAIFPVLFIPSSPIGGTHPDDRRGPVAAARKSLSPA